MRFRNTQGGARPIQATSYKNSDKNNRKAYNAYPLQGQREGYVGQTAYDYSRKDTRYSSKAGKMSSTKKVALGLVAVLVFLIVGGGTAFALYANSINESLAGSKTKEEIDAIESTLVAVQSYSDPFYVVLIGSDERTDSEDMGKRSDTNILVRVDPANCAITLLSIPRDTKIELDGYGVQKFNAAYSYFGTAGAIEATSELCDVDISHYAEVNFDELIELVDVIGGVEIDVEQRIDNPKAGSVVIEEGLQTLDGEAALVYVRDRDYADGDYTRTSHQRELIEAILKKIMNLSVAELPGAIQKAAGCVTTDLKVDQIIDLALQFKDINNLKIYSAVLPSTTAMIDGLSYVIADPQGLIEVMKLVESGKDPSTYKSTFVYTGGNSAGSAEYTDSSDNDAYSYGDSYYEPQDTWNGDSSWEEEPPENIPSETPDPSPTEPEQPDLDSSSAGSEQ